MSECPEEGAFLVGASFPIIVAARLAMDVWLLKKGKAKKRVRDGPGCCGYAYHRGCNFFAGFNERAGGRWELTALSGVEYDNYAGHGVVGARPVAAVTSNLDINQKRCTHKTVQKEMSRRFGVIISRSVTSESFTFRRQHLRRASSPLIVSLSST